MATVELRENNVAEEEPKDLSNCPYLYSDGQEDRSQNDTHPFLVRGLNLISLDMVIEWVIYGLLPKQSITLLHGKGGIGKTWLSLGIANAVTKGEPFMGLPTKATPSIYIDYENSLPVLVERVKKIGAEEVLFWHNQIKTIPKIDSYDWKLFKELTPESLLIIDSLRASQTRDENDSQQMTYVMSKFKELRDMGFTILLIHHAPKYDDKTFKGSTAISDQADHVLSFHHEKKDCYHLGTKDKTRYEPFCIYVTFDEEQGFIKVKDPVEDKLIAMQGILNKRGLLNQSQFFKEVIEQLGIKSKKTFTDLLDRGEGIFWIREKSGKEVHYMTIETVQVSDTIYEETDGQV